MVIDDGSGFDQPILVNGPELAIFDDGDGYSLRALGVGELCRIPKGASGEFWQGLRDAGWYEPDLSGPGDDYDEDSEEDSEEDGG